MDKKVKLKPGISTLEFCLTYGMAFYEDDYIIIENQKIKVPVCNIENSCKFHGQQISDGRYVCDYLLKKENEMKRALYEAGGKNVWE